MSYESLGETEEQRFRKYRIVAIIQLAAIVATAIWRLTVSQQQG